MLDLSISTTLSSCFLYARCHAPFIILEANKQDMNTSNKPHGLSQLKQNALSNRIVVLPLVHVNRIATVFLLSSYTITQCHGLCGHWIHTHHFIIIMRIDGFSTLKSSPRITLQSFRSAIVLLNHLTPRDPQRLVSLFYNSSAPVVLRAG